MTYLNASEARQNLYQLIDSTAMSHIPLKIKGKRNSVVMIAETDWNDIEETLFVDHNKDLSDSIIKGLNTPYSECSKTLE